MGGQISKQKQVWQEKKKLGELQRMEGAESPIQISTAQSTKNGCLTDLRAAAVNNENFARVAVKNKLMVASVCAAGDIAAYERAAEFGDDVVIVAAYRTPICKAKHGGFKDTLVDDLLAPVLKALIDRTGLNPVEVGDIVVGIVLAPGSQRASRCRMAIFLCWIPRDCTGQDCQ